MRQAVRPGPLGLLVRLVQVPYSGTTHNLRCEALAQRLMSSTATSTSAPVLPPLACWQCAKGIARSCLVCEGCGKVQPPSDGPVDAYAMLVENNDARQAPKFDIDLRELEQRYKALQKKLHPDKFSAALPAEKEYSAEQAIRVNIAYAALKDPISRADCLLRLYGVGDGEGLTIGALPRHSEMLSVIMEWREEIEAANDEQTLVRLRERVGRKIDECLERLKVSFDEVPDVERAKEDVQVLRYLVRMQDAIVDKL